ncbi:uncharacterized protein BDR25DRAFT_349596 [Lindgomyces ingoldianus]|uniref:Uncharacterized protein n=1 Tax=Lindgomyces ingoldianus TaxID=673940 RepID=A0ACB6RDC1_9PLEO|nr:uncharacterized protein BDR25DRAFT_349596 [Lindgomyces ingoldianus]KAF2476517.1 hypothetical protein BDR25DRAFT_349596 [Lindgomyces ingoldianus]
MILINDGGIALLTSYDGLQYDLSAYCQGVFREANMLSSEVIVQWYCTDHVSLFACHFSRANRKSLEVEQLPNHHGTSFTLPLSTRAMPQAMEVSSRPEVAALQINNTFSKRHTIISLFDNGGNGLNKTTRDSSGCVLTRYEGNMQIFANGGVFHSDAVWFVQYRSTALNYRAYSNNWVLAGQTHACSAHAIRKYHDAAHRKFPQGRFWDSMNNEGDLHLWEMYLKIDSNRGEHRQYTNRSFSPKRLRRAVLGNSSLLEVNGIDGNGIGLRWRSTPLNNSVPTRSSAMLNSTVRYCSVRDCGGGKLEQHWHSERDGCVWYSAPLVVAIVFLTRPIDSINSTSPPISHRSHGAGTEPMSLLYHMLPKTFDTPNTNIRRTIQFKAQRLKSDKLCPHLSKDVSIWNAFKRGRESRVVDGLIATHITKRHTNIFSLRPPRTRVTARLAGCGAGKRRNLTSFTNEFEKQGPGDRAAPDPVARKRGLCRRIVRRPCLKVPFSDFVNRWVRTVSSVQFEVSALRTLGKFLKPKSRIICTTMYMLLKATGQNVFKRSTMPQVFKVNINIFRLNWFGETEEGECTPDNNLAWDMTGE